MKSGFESSLSFLASRSLLCTRESDCMFCNRHFVLVVAVAMALVCVLAGASQKSDSSKAGQGVIEGIVESSAGQPVEGALIAANRVDAPAPAAMTHSGKGGRFHIENLTPGEYVISAAAPHLAGAFQGGVKVVSVGVAQRVEVKFGENGVAVSGVVEDVNGHPLPRAQIEAAQFMSGGVIYVQADETGKYSATLRKAMYALSAKAEGYDTDAKTLFTDRDRRADFS